MLFRPLLSKLINMSLKTKQNKIVTLRQANPKAPSKMYYNLIFGKDKLLMKTFKLNKFTYDSSGFHLLYFLNNMARPCG